MSRLRQQVKAFHSHVFQQQDMLLRTDVPYDKEGRQQLLHFRYMCEANIQQGLYQNLNDIELTSQLARLLLKLAHFWERQRENEKALADFPTALGEALRCTDLVAEVTADKTDRPHFLFMHLEAKTRWLQYTRNPDLDSPPDEVQRDRACELAGLLSSVEGRATVSLDPEWTTNCLLMIDWGVSHEEAQRLAQDLTDNVATLVMHRKDQSDSEDEPDHWVLWLSLLRTQATLELSRNPGKIERLIEEMRRVAREGRARRESCYEHYLVIQLDTLRHWCKDAVDRRDEVALLERLATWRECFEEVLVVGKKSLKDHITVAGRLVPLEARLLQRLGKRSAARELLLWLLKRADEQAPRGQPASFPWEQFQARARIAMAQLDLSEGRRDRATQSLSEALNRLARWISDPENAQAAYEVWFDARLTVVEARGPEVPFELVHRELLDLYPHCPGNIQSRNRYARTLFDTALRAGQINAARKALSIIQDEHPRELEVGEECNGANLRKCLESILEATENFAL